MVIIKYGNSYSKIIGLTTDQLKGLRQELSYKVDFNQARFIPNPANRVKYCIDLKGNFATGLLDRVQSFLGKHNIDFSMDSIDLSKVTLKRIYRAFNPDFNVVPYLSQIDAVVRLERLHRGVCSMPTGTGKSHVIAMLLHTTRLKTLIVVPTLELKSQLTNTLAKAFTSMEGITVENIDSTALNKATDYDCLIIDECHRSASKTYRDLNRKAWGGIRWRYAFSATPFRNDKEEQLLYEGVAGSVVYELTYKEAVSKGYIVPVEAYYYELPKIPVKGESYAEVYSELVVNRTDRNELIANLLKNLYYSKKQTLCLVKEIKHGEILSELTKLPFVNGQDGESRMWIKLFAEGKVKGLIATEGLMGEGIDSKSCEFVIIAGGGKARSSFMQKVGRAVRTYPGKQSAKVILFKDKSNKWMLTHYKIQSTILETEYGTQVIKMGIE